MKQVSYEEVKQSYKIVDRSVGEHGWFNSNEIEPLKDFIEQHKPPTWEKVVNAWGKVTHYNVVHEDGYVLIGDNTIGGVIYASINLDKGILDIPSEYNWDTHKAVDLTVKYLENHQCR